MAFKRETYQSIASNFIPDRNRQRNAVFYGRVSTQHEAQLDALENQMQWYEDQTKYHPNWTILGRYIDEGITGTLAKKRPSFMAMIDDAKQGKFDLIVTREVCRFARNTVDTLVITRELKKFGVEVYFVEDNIWTMDGDGELRLTIMATLAQEESRKISERVRAGQAVSREKGVLYGNGNIIGYDRAGDTYVVNEEQARTVRVIYDLYSKGIGQQTICNELTRLGCKDGEGKVKWSCPKISRILRNATYMGYKCYNKSVTNNYLEKHRIKNLDEDSIIMVKGTFEPLVSEEIWYKCKRIRESRNKIYGLPTGEERRIVSKSPKHLWSRKLKCRCGSGFSRYRWRVLQNGTPVYGYQCTQRSHKMSRQYAQSHGIDIDNCTAISICEWKLELMAKRIFEQVWDDKKNAVLRACEMLENCFEESNGQHSMRTQEIQSKLEKNEQRLLCYVEMRADGELSKDEYLKLRSQLEKEKAQLCRQLNESGDQKQQTALNLRKIKNRLSSVIDISKPIIADELIDEFVEQVMPIEDNVYRWKLNMDKPDTIGSHYDLRYPKTPPILRFVINFEDAKKYRMERDMPAQFRRNFWSDLRVEVYM